MVDLYFVSDSRQTLGCIIEEPQIQYLTPLVRNGHWQKCRKPHTRTCRVDFIQDMYFLCCLHIYTSVDMFLVWTSFMKTTQGRLNECHIEL